MQTKRLRHNRKPKRLAPASRPNLNRSIVHRLIILPEPLPEMPRSPTTSATRGAAKIPARTARPILVETAFQHHRFRRKRILLLGCGVLVSGLGYDPAYNYYDYDGPVYTYGNLLPDQVILNVQRALKQLGYYAGALTGRSGQPRGKHWRIISGTPG